jgi:ABC-type transport system involved in cytochrome bd biosynthesis fused ATPase/permease subunit
MNQQQYRKILSSLFKISSLLSKEDKRKIIVSSALLAASSFLEVLTVASMYPFLKYILEGYGANNPYLLKLIAFDTSGYLQSETRVFIGFAYLVLVLLSAVFKIFVLKRSGKTVAVVSNNLATIIFTTSIFGSSSNKSTSEVVSNIISRCNYAMGSLFNVISIITSGLLALGILYSLLYFSPVITIIGFLILLAQYVVISKFTSKKSIHNGQIIDEQSVAQLAHAKQSLDSAKNIIIENRVNEETNHFKVIDLNIRLARFSNQLINNLPRLIIETLVMIIVAFVVIYLSIMNLDLLKIIPLLSIFAISFLKLLPSFNSIYINHVNILQSASPVIKLADQIQDISQKSYLSESQLDFDEMSIVDLGHNSKITKKLMYVPITLKIHKGDKFLINGASGVGKSTILESMIGLTKPTMGKVLVNEIEIREDYLRKWWATITYIPQAPYVYNNSIKYNVTLRSDNIDEEHYSKVSRLTRLDLISQNDNNFLVAENGGNLSGGEKQRLILARALYMRRKVLFCDEAMSAIDSSLRFQILESIFKTYPDLTVIFISHNSEESKLFNRHMTVKKNL